MNLRIGFLVLLALSANWVSDARNLAASDLLDVENAGGNVEICTVCEQYASLALSYIEDDKTETEVIQALHNTCSQLHGLKEKCIILVDRYAPMFFLEISSVQPEGFCKKVGLCRKSKISYIYSSTKKCEICQHAVDNVLDKLKDPDTKLDIVELLLKTCNAMDKKYARKCKNIVLEFGPLILTDAEKFIEKADICNTLHACRKSKEGGEEALLVDEKIKMVSSS